MGSERRVRDVYNADKYLYKNQFFFLLLLLLLITFCLFVWVFEYNLITLKYFLCLFLLHIQHIKISYVFFCDLLNYILWGGGNSWGFFGYFGFIVFFIIYFTFYSSCFKLFIVF